MTALGKLRKSLFGIPSEKAVFDRPGFVPEAWQRFQPVAHGLVEGYHATLEDSRFEVLVPRLEAVEAELRGFAYEGAGMGLAALDIMAPWKNRLLAFIEGPASGHMYTLYVGMGLALARLRRRPERFFARLDPIQRWVVVDGYGFHEGFFSWKRTVQEKKVPSRLSPYARRLFDQGLGRSIWFASGALVDRVAAIVGAFPLERQADLWSGVGMACSYAGGASRSEIEILLESAAPYRSQLARGAAVAAKGRQDGGNPAPHTELACQMFCGLSSEKAAHILDVTSENLPTNGVEPVYEVWRQRTQAQFALEIERKR
jgi:enediyne biosynthesis protein E3